MNTPLPTRIACCGLDKAVINTLEFLVADDSKNSFVLTTASDEFICIRQLKTQADIALMKEYRNKFPERKVIAIFKNEIKGKNIIEVRPPVTPRRLLDALNEAAGLSEPGQAQSSGNNPRLKMSAGVLTGHKLKPEIISEGKEKRAGLSRQDIDLENPEEVDKIRYSAERFLQGRLYTACLKGRANNTNIQIYTPHGTFQYYPREHKALVELNRHSLRNLASVPDTVTAIMTEFDGDNSAKENSRKKLVCADALLWDLTIWASRGRLPFEVDLDQPFTLKSWPNFTRWTITPHAMQITVMWLGGFQTLRQTVAMMGIPQHFIFIFYSAASALDLIVLDEGENPQKNKAEVKKVPSRLKGLIGKLLDYVKPENGEQGE